MKIGINGLGLLGQGGAAAPSALYSSLYRFWALDEASGNRAEAIAGDTLTDNNTVTSTTGIAYPLMAQFTAANSEYLSHADSDALSLGDVDWWLAAWVSLTSKPAGLNAIMGKYLTTGNQREYMLYNDQGNDRFALNVSHDGTAPGVGTGVLLDTQIGSPATATKYFLVASHDHTNDLIKLQIANHDADSASLSGGPFSGTGQFLIGAQNNGALSFLNGLVGPAMIGMGYLPTGLDHAWMYNASYGRTKADMQAYQPGNGRRVVCEGDSLTFGRGLTALTDTYPQQMQVLLGNSYQVFNAGVPGKQITNSNSSFLNTATKNATRIDTMRVNSNSILVVWVGTNDIVDDSNSGATAYNDLVTYCRARQSVGWKVVVLTMLPRTGTDTDRATLNSSIRTNWATFANALADVAADNRIGDNGDNNDTTYYQADAIHIKAAGAAIVAGIVNTAILTL